MFLQEVSQNNMQQSPTLEQPSSSISLDIPITNLSKQLSFPEKIKLFITASLKDFSDLGVSEEVAEELSQYLETNKINKIVSLYHDEFLKLFEIDEDLNSAVDLKVKADQEPHSNFAIEFTASAESRRQQLEALGALFFYVRLSQVDSILFQKIARSAGDGIDNEEVAHLKRFYRQKIFEPATVGARLLTKETEQRNNSADTAILAGFMHGLCDLERKRAFSFTEKIKTFFTSHSEEEDSLSALDEEPIPADVLRLLIDCIYENRIFIEQQNELIVQQNQKAELDRQLALSAEIEKIRVLESGRVEVAKYSAEAAQAKVREAELIVAQEQARLLANQAQKEASLAETRKLLELKEAHSVAKASAEAEAQRLREEQKLAEANKKIRVRELDAAVELLSSNNINTKIPPRIYNNSFYKKASALSLPQDPYLALEAISKIAKEGGVPKMDYTQNRSLIESLKARDLETQINNPEMFSQFQSKWRSCCSELKRRIIAFSLSKEQALAIQSEANLPTNYFKASQTSDKIALIIPKGNFEYEDQGWGAARIWVKSGNDCSRKLISESDATFWMLTAFIEAQNNIDRVP